MASRTSGSLVNQESPADDAPQLQEAHRDIPGITASPFTEKAGHEALGGNRQGIDGQSEKDENLHAHLMGGNLGVADGRRHPGGDREGGEEGGRPEDHVASDPEQTEHLPRVHAAQAQSETAPNEHEEPPGAEPLSGEGGDGGSVQVPADTEDEQWIQNEVHDVEPERDVQRGPGVLVAAKRSVTEGDDEHRRGGEGPNPQVALGFTSHLGRGSHELQDRDRCHLEDDGDQQAERHGRNESVGDDAGGPVGIPLAKSLGDERCHSVRKEVEGEEGKPEHGRVDAEGRERGRAEPSDKGRVDEAHKRIGGQRAERRQAESNYQPVVRFARPAHSGGGVLSG